MPLGSPKATLARTVTLIQMENLEEAYASHMYGDCREAKQPK